MSIRRQIRILNEIQEQDPAYWVRSAYCSMLNDLQQRAREVYSPGHFLYRKTQEMTYPDVSFYRNLSRARVKGHVNGTGRKNLLGMTQIKRVRGKDKKGNAIIPFSEPLAYLTSVSTRFRKYEKPVILICKDKQYEVGDFVEFAVTDVQKNVLLSKIHRPAVQGIDLVVYDRKVGRMLVLSHPNMEPGTHNFNMWYLSYVVNENPQPLKEMGLPEDRVVRVDLGGKRWWSKLFELPREPETLESMLAEHVMKNELKREWGCGDSLVLEEVE